MLKEVLRAIEKGEVSKKEDLAERVGVSVSAIEGALDFLVKRGYLKVTDGTLAAKCDCGHCGKQGFCFDSGKTYVVTEKGKVSIRQKW
jgi:predicted ArsR family transcriptional regulator